MKKLISILALCGLACASHAQVFSSRSFINAQSIYLSNSVTFVTNLLSTVSSGTNNTGVAYTNLYGSSISGTNGQYFNLLKDVPLWTSRDNNVIVGPSTNACIFLRVGAAGAAATNAISLEFVAVPNSTNEDTTTTPITYTTTAVTAVTGGWRFGLGAQFVGCEKIRLRKIYMTAPTAAASQCNILEVSLNGFVP